jgi:transcriptional regulator with XRE-family HTH domain
VSDQDRLELARRIGGELRRLRERAGLTLKELAAAAGLSAPFLSRVENGRALPSLQSLQDLALALKVEVESLFGRAEEQKGYCLSLAGGRRRRLSLRGPDRKLNYEVELLAEGMVDPHMDPALITCLPKSQAGQVELAVHGGQEFVYVLEGVLELTLGERVFVLHPGDAAYFLGTIPHRGLSLSEAPARTLNVHLVPGRRTGSFLPSLPRPILAEPAEERHGA